MGFGAPLFFAGLLAIALPVWLHLRRRHKVNPMPFGSVMFFERRTQSSIKHRRLEDLVLFALRTSLFAALVVAFASPFILSKGATAAGKVIVLAVDQSFSMREGGRLERAKTEAIAKLRQIPAATPVEVATFAGQVHFSNGVGGDRSALEGVLRNIEPTDSRSDYGQLVRALRSRASEMRVPFEVHLFSDMQQNSLPGNLAELDAGRELSLIPHTTGAANAPNWAVLSVKAPGRLYSQKARVEAVVGGFGTSESRKQASLVLNGRVIETKAVPVPGNAAVPVQFSPADVAYGFNRGEVRIAAGDSLGGDDRSFFAIERAEPSPVLFVQSSRHSRAASYFRAAFRASQPDIPVEVRTTDEVMAAQPLNYAFIVLSDPGRIRPAFEEAIQSYLRQGGSVLVALGPESAGLRQVPAAGNAIREMRSVMREGLPSSGLRVLDSAHPALRQATNWEGVNFFRVARIDPAVAHIAAALEDGTPVLTETRVGRGRVVVFSSTLDNTWNDFALHAAFVPFIGETARSFLGLDNSVSGMPVDAWIDLRLPGDRAAAAEVIGPDGKRVLSLSESAKSRALLLRSAGFYEVHRGNGRGGLIAVNADRRESDLAQAPAETLALLPGATSTRFSRPAAAPVEARVALWPYIVLLAFALALAEVIVANRRLETAKAVAARKEAA